MNDFEQYIQPELFVLVAVLYFIGMFFKTSKLIDDRHIPLTLGGIGVVMATMYTIAVSEFSIMCAFTGITQGIICAGVAVYVHQIIKQGTGKK